MTRHAADDGSARVRTLVAGWFSFEGMGATAGDLMVRDLVCEWLESAGRPYDVALAYPFTGGKDWRAVDSGAYSHVIFACGPFGNGEPVTEFLARFADATLVGVNLTMLQQLDEWNPFDLLLERDSSAAARPDLAFLSRTNCAPVVGIVRMHEQPEYGARDLHIRANDAMNRLIAGREMAAVTIDTRLDEVNAAGLRTPGEIESLIARMDVVVTARLHGLVLALKNGVPAVAIDSVGGGAKIIRQARALGWPVVLTADTMTDVSLRQAFERCLSPEVKSLAADVRDRARTVLGPVRKEFLAFFETP
ncbi:MAG: polysaccharide pyruvyl transferase family protein [Gemmatimonadaceae bacterium]